jgi:membrane protease YdiL (CAAX protease family)
MPIKTTVATIFECALVALGWTLIWRLHFSSTAREKRKASPTPVSRWDLNKKNLLLITLWAVLGFALYSRFALLSMLTGALVALFAIQAESLHPVASSPIARPIIKATFRDIGWVGLVTFLAVISVVYPVQLLWEQLLILLHLPTAKQELVELFNHPESFSKTAILAVNAVIIAPITEELFFRGGLFRSLNRCVPR